MIVDKLFQHVKDNGHVCVGLDTDYSYIPKAYANKFTNAADAIFKFNREIIDATCDVAACYKVQIAYYESLGMRGLKAYSDTLKYIKEKGQICIADVKRGDISKTAEMYAKAHFSGDFEADFVTLNPYMGINDSIEPFLKYINENEKGIFVLVRTSNKGAKDFQYIKDENGKTLYENVAQSVENLARINTGVCGYSSIGSVVGAINSEESEALRNVLKTSFLLIPGYGAQGGKAEDIKAYLTDGNGAVVNSSRGILLAYKNEANGENKFPLCARNEVIKMREDINKASLRG